MKNGQRFPALSFGRVEDPSKVDIKIGYGDPSNLIGQDIWYYDPSKNTFIEDLVLLKDPTIAPLSLDRSGHLSYDDGVELKQLTTHEFGVGLGLGEGDGLDVNSVMNHKLTSRNRVRWRRHHRNRQPLRSGANTRSSPGFCLT